ncbi:ABC transporter ATP-binding protein [Sphingomonas naphthae]|uniref:ABC transporter ATP-binding protein n=1 Tax=Sphingomonas naphthae TaxID=1813468 RepID=A0ABY7TQD3_9SPHN|nr:ABC transporter ATP-binding protein [Sphingomonas naphthae]WCT75201.1 ABC transporter ATP-binding protein [Sphingomonas naphthae]
MTLLAFDRVSVRYDGRIALDALSFAIAPGEIVGLIGESGSGKSTAALAAIDLLPDRAAQAGTVHRAADAPFGMIFQEPMSALNPLMTIGAQVAEAVRARAPTGRRAARAEAARLLDRVGLPTDRVPPARYPHQLSGGQRQRVGIAIALAGNPRLLIADEPTTALDATTQARIVALLVELSRERGMALLLVSHDLALVGEVSDRIVVLKDGALVEQGAAADVLGHPTMAYTRALIGSATDMPPRSAPRASSAVPLLEVRGVGRRYPARPTGWRRAAPVTALDDVGFQVMPGETVGVVGESGSGKSTLLRLVLGLDRPDTGDILLGGQPIAGARGAALRRARRTVQAVFQDPGGSLDPRQTVETIVAEPLHLLDTRPTPADRSARVGAALAQVGLDPAAADRHPHQFSGGQRQRIAIARALILGSPLVVLDEAVSALDMSVRAEILGLLCRLSDERGIAFLFVSHDLGAMRAIADRLVVMEGGRIVEQGPAADILGAPAHPYTRALIAATPDLGRVIARRVAQAASSASSP